MFESEIPRTKKTNVYFLGEERENKKNSSITNRLSAIVTCYYTNRKRTRQYFQRHGKRISLATRRHYIHCSKDMNISYMFAGTLLPPIAFLI